jgi:prepilin-type N-terminal cleavage/methylation domain-containing protein
MKKNSFFKRKFNFKTSSAFTLVEISVVIIIIGILLAGISQVFEMISEASLKSARTLSKASRITRTDDLSLWLDATSEKAFDKEKDDNSTVSIWKDTNPKSTSPASSSSTLSSLYPSYILSGISSLPAVRFKKTSATVGNCVTIPSQSFVNNSEDFTLYLTYSPITLDDGIIIEKNNATATSFPFSLELNSGFYKFSVKDSSNTISVTGARQAKINTPNLIRLSRTKGSQIEISINGISSSQSDTLTSSTFNNAELSIGCRNGATPANFINGDIGETSFFNRNLSVKEKTDIEEYLYKKWKMKKNEGALATQEFIACTVPSNINADPAVTTVQPTAGGQIACKADYNGAINYKCSGGSFSVTTNSCSAITCTVPSDINADPAVTTVQPTAGGQIACKTGYNGAINYKCSGGSFSVTTNSCSIMTCTVPNDRNTTADGTQVSFTSSSLPLTCKSGYGGNITYTCDGSGVFGSSGSCSPNCTIPTGRNTTMDGSQVSFTSTATPLTCASGYSGSPTYTCNNSGTISIVGSCAISCSVSTSVVENFVGYSAKNPGVVVNLAAVIGSNVAVGTVGTYKFTAYAQESWAGPYYAPWSLRYRCKADGTMDYDFQSGCHPGNWTTKIYFAETFADSWCCAGPFLGSSTSSCSWSY